ncbi:hypothetical protein [Namhaeicola litoreus]|uniref:Adhesin domain-containing protein n=1 Tax=Namhaeicola litoreus TaxID=1052145 RepID=A0ABW3XXP2_9FLAO
MIKSYSTQAERVMLRFDLIDRVEVRSYDGDLIKINAFDDFGGYLNFYVEERGNFFIISQQNSNFIEEGDISKICAVQPVYAAYIIDMPRNKRVDLVIEEGICDVNHFDGKLRIELQKGEIHLEPFKGEVDMFLNVGNVHCTINDTEVNIVTNLGVMETDLTFVNEVKASNSLSGFYQSQKNQLIVKSINGNIYLK